MIHWHETPETPETPESPGGGEGGEGGGEGGGGEGGGAQDWRGSETSSHRTPPHSAGARSDPTRPSCSARIGLLMLAGSGSGLSNLPSRGRMIRKWAK